MANTATLRTATPNRLVYELVGDGTVAGPTIANATMQADLPAGPLKTALGTARTSSQAAMRIAMLYGQPIKTSLTLMSTPVDTTGQVNQPFVDADTDAVSPTLPELNVSMSDTTGQIAMLCIEYLPPAVR